MRENYQCFLENFLTPKSVNFLNSNKEKIKVNKKGVVKIKKVKDHPLSKSKTSEWN